MPRQRAQNPANGAAVRVIRERTGLSIAAMVTALADIGIDVHEDHLRNIELGHKQPSPRLLVGMATVLMVPQTALMASPAEPAITA